MGGVSFTWIPTWVTPREEAFAVLITTSESYKKDRQLLDDNSIQIYDLEFIGVVDSDRNGIKAHFSSVSGPYDVFWWDSTPSYLNIGSGVSVFYLVGGYKEDPSSKYWNIKVSFEVEV